MTPYIFPRATPKSATRSTAPFCAKETAVGGNPSYFFSRVILRGNQVLYVKD